jgi:hypothetical protein
MTFLDARRVALALPGVEEGPSYGTSGFRVSGKLFARVKEDGVTLVVRTDRDTREALLGANPSTFFVTPHYRGYDWMLIRLPSVKPEELRDQIVAAWKRRAPKKLLAAFDSRLRLTALGSNRHLRLVLCTRSDNGSSVRLTGIHQAASTPPSKG